MNPYFHSEKAGITIYHGDCREHLPFIATPVTLVLTDIPYGEVNRKSSGLRNLDKGVADVPTIPLSDVAGLLSALSSSIYVWCGTEQVSTLRSTFVDAGMTTRLCIWEKSNPSPLNGTRLWLSGIEACIFGRRAKAYFAEHCATPVWRGAATRNKLHPTQKPEWLFSRLITASCPVGGTVLDPFMGSGTTLVSALRLGRSAIGIEREERYCEVAALRLQEASK